MRQASKCEVCLSYNNLGLFIELLSPNHPTTFQSLDIDNENGIKQLYTGEDKHPDVRLMVINLI